MSREVTRESARIDDAGLGLLEIVISMFLISLLAISFIPVLIAGLRAAESNSTTATATRLVAQAIDVARTTGANDCADAEFLDDPVIEEVDAQGVTIRVTTSIGSCTPGGTVAVTARAVDTADASATAIAQARTLVFVGGSTP